MRDEKISLPRLNALHPLVINEFKQFIETCEEQLDITLRITQGLRTIAEQDALYAQGRTKPGKIVTKAKGGSSFHNFGTAIDVLRLDNGKADWNYDLEKLVTFMPDNMDWGGHWQTIKDDPHFQITFGYKWQELLQKYNAGDFIPGTKFVNITPKVLSNQA